MSTWLKIVLALLVAALVVVGIGLVYLYSGAYNVAATDEHTGLVRWALNTTQERSIRAHADEAPLTVPQDSATLRRGFDSYEEMCVVCHGAPGVERGWMGQGMNPTPPDLAEEADEFSPQELHWILSNGIKMAGMPALSPTHGEAEIVEIVAFLEHLPEMSEDEYRRWKAAASDGAAPDSSSGDGHHGHSH